MLTQRPSSKGKDEPLTLPVTRPSPLGSCFALYFASQCPPHPLCWGGWGTARAPQLGKGGTRHVPAGHQGWPPATRCAGCWGCGHRCKSQVTLPLQCPGCSFVWHPANKARKQTRRPAEAALSSRTSAAAALPAPAAVPAAAGRPAAAGAAARRPGAPPATRAGAGRRAGSPGARWS